MRRKTFVSIHVTATMVAMLSIATFFISSILAEISGDEALIRQVKEAIFFSLPLLLVAMPTLGISGNKLAGKSNHPIVLLKQKRMKFIIMNGIILTSLACFLYYRSHYQSIDTVFLGVQFAEFGFGLINLSLIGLNINSGLKLSGKNKKKMREMQET